MRLTQWESREGYRATEPHDLPQLIDVLNAARRNDRLYVRLLAPSSGAVVDGQSLPGLPPSVLAVFDGTAAGAPRGGSAMPSSASGTCPPTSRYAARAC